MRWNSGVVCNCALESLEERRLLAWGAYPQLIDQDLATSTYPAITGSGVNIALIDSGVDFNHPNLAGKFWANPGEIAGNGIDDDGDGYKDDVRGWDFYGNDNNPEDQNGHGTAMSGILAAKPFTYGGYTYAGIAQGAKIIPLKVSDPTGGHSTAFDQRVEKALQWVERNYQRYNIRVVSMSIHSDEASYRATYADEISRLATDGLFITAAGGEGDPNVDVVYPAMDPNVFAVNIVNVDDTISSIATRGPNLDLLAPGNEVPILLRGGSFDTSGEAASYANPFAAGAAALLLQAKPSLTPAQITSILKTSGSNVYDPLSKLTFKRLDLDNALALAGAMPAVVQTPYRGSAFTTDMRIQAEDFDNGGESVGYHDADGVNTTGQYRAGGVDIEPTADKRGGYNVTLAKAGEWLEYTVYVPSLAIYTFYARVASKSTGGSFHVEIDGMDRTGAIAVPKTGSWQSWLAIPKAIKLKTGQHIMRVVMHGNNRTGNGAGNFNWFSLISPAAPAAAVVIPQALPAVAQPFSTTKLDSALDGLLE